MHSAAAVRTWNDLSLTERLHETRAGDVVEAEFGPEFMIRASVKINADIKHVGVYPLANATDLRIVTPVLRVGDRVLTARGDVGTIREIFSGIAVLESHQVALSDCERLPQPEECDCYGDYGVAGCPLHGTPSDPVNEEPPIGSIMARIGTGWGNWRTTIIRNTPDGWVYETGMRAGTWSFLQDAGYTVAVRWGWDDNRKPGT